MSSNIPTFTKLGPSNYPTWAGEMRAWLRSAGLWCIVDGTTQCPTLGSPSTDGSQGKIEEWVVKADRAAGLLYLMVEQSQRVHFNGIDDDPVKMWVALRDVHLQQ
jgi:hypothetical protein